MIKNRRQRQQTQKRIEEFEDAISKFQADIVPEGVDPVIHRATVEGIRSILSTLEREAAEYDDLSRGSQRAIVVENLDGLPEGLIKARIAMGLTQRDLAVRLGVTQQQVQRWEFEDYENVGFGSLVDVAHALGVSVSEIIELNDSSVRTTLDALGIDKQFLKRRLVPANDNSQNQNEQIVAAAGRLTRIFGINLSANGEVSCEGLLKQAGASMRFKVPNNADAKRTKAYSAYVEYLCKRVAQGMVGLRQHAVPRDWRVLSEILFNGNVVSFQSAAEATWRLGIAILPLSDPIRFHGCCYRVESRNVVVLKQSVRHPSRWLFDLVHELYHAGESPESTEFEQALLGPTEAARRSSGDEAEANEFAGNVLLGGQARDLYSAVLNSADYTPARLKRSTSRIARESGVDVGILANYVAFRLKSDQSIDWWGAATNLQPEGADPFSSAKALLMNNVDLSQLSDDDQLLIKQALEESII